MAADHGILKGEALKRRVQGGSASLPSSPVPYANVLTRTTPGRARS